MGESSTTGTDPICASGLADRLKANAAHGPLQTAKHTNGGRCHTGKLAGKESPPEMLDNIDACKDANIYTII